MDKKLPIYYGVIILLCTALLIFFFVKSQSEKNNELKNISLTITQLKSLDSAVKKELLNLSLYKINHNDFLTASIDRLDNKSQQFFKEEKILSHARLIVFWKQYVNALEEKKYAVEQYK